jgi:predicted RNA polymerase sigma factor
MPVTPKLTPENKLEIFLYFQSGIQIKELAHAFGVGSWTIQNIITEKLKENFDNVHNQPQNSYTKQ